MKIPHPLCGYSLQKGAKAIAIADLVVSCFVIVTRGIAYEYMYKEYEVDLGEYNETVWNTGDNATEYGETLPGIHDPIQHAQEFGSYTHHDTPHHLEPGMMQMLGLVIFLVVLAIVFLIVYVGMEVWLCRLLLRASKNRDGTACKTWFWFRLFITLLFLIVSIVSMITLKHDWVDWALEPLNLYRIYALVVVNEFRKEIVATSGRLKLRA
jgi:hypothetical protein